MSTDLSQFQESFFEESAEHLSTIEDGLLQLEQRPQDLDLLNRIFRAAHSIKGNSGMFGFTAVGQFTHKMETLLDKLRNSELSVTVPITDVLLRSTDCLKQLIEAARGGPAPDPEMLQGLEQELASSAGGQQAAPQSSSSSTTHAHPVAQSGPALNRYRITWTAPGWLFQRGLDPVRMIGELEDLGTIVSRTLDTSHLPPMSQLDPEVCYLGWVIELTTVKEKAVIEGVFDFVRDEGQLTIEACTEPVAQPVTSAPVLPPPTQPTGQQPLGEILVESGVVTPEVLNKALSTQKRLGDILVEQKAATPQQISQALQKQQETASQSKKSGDAASIRVDTGKIDKLINLVGELVITQAMLSQKVRDLDPVEHQTVVAGVGDLERNTRHLQDAVMSIRMIPMAFVFNRFPRMIRDLAAKLGKKVELVTSGEATELDKGLIEKITDPLTHLVRNSVDHGVEPPEKRRALGKPETGTITLSAFHQGGSIVIEVRDDGAGLNRDKLLSKAREKGLPVHDGMTDQEVWALIFAPGFSTAEVVTDVSGRGVGMDVVKKNIAALNGSVEIDSQLGKGTRITVRLPLTLAIMDGMSVSVSDEIYIIPIASVVESLQLTGDQIKTIANAGRVVKVREEYLPVASLAEIFEAPRHNEQGGILVVVEADGARTAVLVDELVGQHQVVVKNLESNYRKVPGVSGATILGDGRVALIIDVIGVAKKARH